MFHGSLCPLQALVASLLLPGSGAATAAAQPPKELLPYAAARGHLVLVTELLSEGVPADTADSNGVTALQHAVAAGRTAMVTILLNHGAAVDRQDASGWTALHRAMAKGQHGTAELLLRHGASPDQPVPGTNETLLGRAAASGDIADMRMLLSGGANISSLSRGIPPLCLAAANGHTKAAELLLDHGAAIDRQDTAGWTGLTHAAYRSHAAAVRLLLSRGAAADVLTEFGNTALTFAAMHNDAAIVRLILASTNAAQAPIDGQAAERLVPPNSTILQLLQRPEAVCEGMSLQQLFELSKLIKHREQVRRPIHSRCPSCAAAS